MNPMSVKVREETKIVITAETAVVGAVHGIATCFCGVLVMNDALKMDIAG